MADLAIEAITSESPFKRSAQTLLDAGYHPIPVMPRDKAPGTYQGDPGRGHWTLAYGWNDFVTQKPNDAYMARWMTWPDANVGIVLGTPVGGYVLVAIDFDTEDEGELEMLRSQLPPSRMQKRGHRGFTGFYRASKNVKTKRYMIPAPTADKPNAKRTVLEILTGNAARQTVMPPSWHPIGREYEWMTGEGIVPAHDLPVLADHHFDALEDTLEHIGWVDDSAAPRRVVSSVDDNDDDLPAYVNRCLNQTALDKLDTWAGELGLPKLRRTSSGWEAVPDWRASNENRPLSVRKASLKLHRDGIRDMGVDRGLTAIDTVVDAKGFTPNEAFGWLDERVHAFPEHDDMPTDAEMTANEERRQRAAVQRIATAQASILTWDDREANAAKPFGWLVKNLFPRVGVSVLWGQSGSGKSFVALDLAYSIASGVGFFSHRVKESGGTLFAFGEGESSMPGRLNAVRLGKIGDEPLTNALTGEVMDRDRLPIVWMPVGNLSNDRDFNVFAEHVRKGSAEMERLHGCPLRLVILDTVVASFNFTEDPDAAAATGAMKRLDALAQELRILIVAVHHAGKSKQAGEHGSYAWRGLAETSIQVDAERNDTTSAVEKRRLYVKKNRHGGNEGWNAAFELSTVTLGSDEDGDDITSCVVIPSYRPEQTANELSPAAARFVAAFHVVHDARGGSRIMLETGACVVAVKDRDAKAQFVADDPGRTTEDSKRRQSDRGRKAAIEAGYLGEEFVDGDRWVFVKSEVLPCVPDNDNDEADRDDFGAVQASG